MTNALAYSVRAFFDEAKIDFVPFAAAITSTHRSGLFVTKMEKSWPTLARVQVYYFCVFRLIYTCVFAVRFCIW